METEEPLPVETDEAKKERKEKRKRKKNLFKEIRNQMEFYFSDSNLMKDKFLSQLMYENPEGLVPLDIFFNFNRIRTLNCTKADICNALAQSELLQVSEDKQHVCRTTEITVKTNVDECTIYVEHLPSDVDQQWIRNAFSSFGTIDYISLPRFKHKGNIKGFAFVEFSTPEEAMKACKHFGLCEEDVKDGVAVDDSMEHSSKSKRKRGTSESEDSGKKKVRQRTNTETSNEDSVVQVAAKLEETNVLDPEEEPIVEEKKKDKKKRSRKKKRKFQEEQEKPVQTLRVMPKEEWKRWKNKYLSMQKETMSQIKLSLSGVEGPPPFKENKRPQKIPVIAQESQPEVLAVEKKLRKKDQPLKFIEGVIIRLKLKQPVENATHIKAQMRTLGTIAYVDIQEGEKVTYLRCATPEESQRILSLPDLPGKVRLLVGEEESNYWQKLEADRQNKFNNNTRNSRGSKKVLTKLEKKQNVHINFN